MANIKKYIEPAIHLIIWVIAFALLATQAQALGEFRQEDGTIFFPMLFGTITSVILFYFNALYLIPRLITKNRYLDYFYVILAVYTGISVTDSVIDHFCFISYYSSANEPLWSESLMNFFVNLLILSLSMGYGFTKNWLRNERNRQQLTEDKLNAELKFLKAQINPHFLFNTLNMAYSSAIKSGDAATADIIEKLAVLMRYVLYESNGEKVSLGKEISYIENYISLQVQRLAPELAVNINCKIEGDWDGFQIAPMILAPFIENAFKHGVRLNENQGLAINIKLDSARLTLETSNNLNTTEVSTAKADSGIGLINVKRRLQIIYPNRHKLEIKTNNNIYLSRLELEL